MKLIPHLQMNKLRYNHITQVFQSLICKKLILREESQSRLDSGS